MPFTPFIPGQTNKSGFTPFTPNKGDVSSNTNPIPETKPNFLQTLVGGVVKNAKENISDIKTATNQVSEGNKITKNAKNFTDYSKGEYESTKGVARTGLRIAGGLASVALSPLTETLKPILSPAVEKLSSNPKLQHLAQPIINLANKHPEASKDIANIIDLLTLGVGKEAEAPVKEFAGKVTEKLGQNLSKVAPTLEKIPDLEEVAGKVKGKIVGTQESKLSKLAEETSGVADKKNRISALEKTGAVDKTGKPIAGAKQSLFGGIKTVPSESELARAKDIQGIVDIKASPVKNLTNLNKEISRISEKEVGPALEKAGATKPISDKAPGWNTTVQRLTDIEKPDIIKPDETLSKTYDLVRQRMIEAIKKQPATVKGLWDARISFDKIVQDQFGDAAFDSEKNTAIKRAIKDMRSTVNDIIAEREPTYKTAMKKLTNLYDTRYNIAEQYQNLVNKGGIKAFTKLNPKTATALKWGGGLIGYETVKHTVAPFLP